MKKGTVINLGLGHFLSTVHGSLNALCGHHRVLEEESQGLQHAGEQEIVINTMKLLI